MLPAPPLLCFFVVCSRRAPGEEGGEGVKEEREGLGGRESGEGLAREMEEGV